MNRIKIKLRTPEKVTEFINICNNYISDINLYYGSIVIDAKSIVSVFSLCDNKILEVEMISSDEAEIERFTSKISQFTTAGDS